MFTSSQRLYIVWSSFYFLLATSLLPVLVHGLMNIALPYYLSVIILLYLTLYGWRTSIAIWRW